MEKVLKDLMPLLLSGQTSADVPTKDRNYRSATRHDESNRTDDNVNRPDLGIGGIGSRGNGDDDWPLSGSQRYRGPLPLEQRVAFSRELLPGQQSTHHVRQTPFEPPSFETPPPWRIPPPCREPLSYMIDRPPPGRPVSFQRLPHFKRVMRESSRFSGSIG